MKKRTPLLALGIFGALLVLLAVASAQSVNCSGVTAWVAGGNYTVGELVTYQGSEYKCLQANNNAAPNWDPIDWPAGWSLVGTCTSGPTATATRTATGTATRTATGTATRTATGTATRTATGTATRTATATATRTATATPTSTGGSCYPAWSSTTAYNGGATVSYNGVNYTAAYWSQGSEPDTNNGPAGSGEPWISDGSCTGGGGTPTPTATATRTATGTATRTATQTATPTPCQVNCSASGFIFAPYKDVTVDANWNTGAQQTTITGSSVPVTQAMPNKTLIWSFATGTCGSETWAGISPALEASNVSQFTSAGKDYIISTGGAAGSFDCPGSLGSFISTYYSSNMLGVDFDIETGQSQGVINDLVNAAKGAESSYPNLRFSFTLASFGSTAANPILNSTGVAVVNAIKSSGLGGNYTVNPMAFDFGSPNPTYCTVVGGVCEMGQSAIAAMEAVNSQFGIPYGHIEVTLEVPTDDGGAAFTMANVTTVCSWIKSNGVAGIRYWSLDRDTGATYASAIKSACGAN